MQENREISPADGSFRWISVSDEQFEPADVSSEDDFEFSFLDLNESPDITADEIFSDGQIRPVYPVFNRDLVDIKEGNEDEDGDDDEQDKQDDTIRTPLLGLLVEDPQPCSRSSSSSSSDPDTVPPGTYCVWEPRFVPASPDRMRRSTGTAHKWRLRDLVVGRSHSDGKEKYVFLSNEDRQKLQLSATPGKDKASTRATSSPERSEKAKKAPTSATSSPARSEQAKKGKGKGKKVTEMDMVTAHRLFYGKDAAAAAAAASGRRSFLPYKPVGLFANVKVLSRTHHPF